MQQRVKQNEKKLNLFNPLLRTGHNSVHMTKILILKQEGIIKKNFL